MTIWKATLLATQWLLISTQAFPLEKQHSLSYQQQVLPPKEFDHDYDGTLIIVHLDAAGIWDECHLGAKPNRAPPLACARRATKSCWVYILTEPELEKRGWSYDIIMRHEIGHCNGWHHD